MLQIKSLNCGSIKNQFAMIYLIVCFLPNLRQKLVIHRANLMLQSLRKELETYKMSPLGYIYKYNTTSKTIGNT
jgi:hypothetical protein